MFIRPALRKMQGFTTFERPRAVATLAKDRKKKDGRVLLLARLRLSTMKTAATVSAR